MMIDLQWVSPSIPMQRLHKKTICFLQMYGIKNAAHKLQWLYRMIFPAMRVLTNRRTLQGYHWNWQVEKHRCDLKSEFLGAHCSCVWLVEKTWETEGTQWGVFLLNAFWFGFLACWTVVCHGWILSVLFKLLGMAARMRTSQTGLLVMYHGPVRRQQMRSEDLKHSRAKVDLSYVVYFLTEWLKIPCNHGGCKRHL